MLQRNHNALKTRYAIVGGGPAGALAAANLARAGREVIVFEERLAWEKPCGGGITHKGLLEWPFLGAAEIERNWVQECELIAPSGRRVLFRLQRPVAIFSRQVLNGLLLERARAAGATIFKQRVYRIEQRGESWYLESASRAIPADYLILACGARTPFRKQLAQPFAAEDLMVTAGYYIPGRSHTMQIQFLDRLHGYIWIFPRADHVSAGICGRLKDRSTSELRRLLETWLPRLGFDFREAGFYSHILPSLRPSTLRHVAVNGKSWALIGDAAGFVDAITGEGLYYALRSAELLSQALLEDSPEAYAAHLRQDFLPELEAAAGVANRFYGGRWLGRTVIERMIQFTENSGSFRELMRDMFAGSQNYRDLRYRLYRSLPAMLAESLASALRLPSSHAGIDCRGNYRVKEQVAELWPSQFIR
jgi:flavin-dependent dehydrogenase